MNVFQSYYMTLSPNKSDPQSPTRQSRFKSSDCASIRSTSTYNSNCSNASPSSRSSRHSSSSSRSNDFKVLLKQLLESQLAYKRAQSQYASSLLRIGEYHIRNEEYEEALAALRESLMESKSVCDLDKVRIGSGGSTQGAAISSRDNSMPSIMEIFNDGERFESSLISSLSSSQMSEEFRTNNRDGTSDCASPSTSSRGWWWAGNKAETSKDINYLSTGSVAATVATLGLTDVSSFSEISSNNSLSTNPYRSMLSTSEGLSIRESSLNDTIAALSNIGKVHSLRKEEKEAVKYYDEKMHIQAWFLSTSRQRTSVEASADAAGGASSTISPANQNSKHLIEASCLGSPAVFFSEGNATHIVSEINEDMMALDELFRGITFCKDMAREATQISIRTDDMDTVHILESEDKSNEKSKLARVKHEFDSEGNKGTCERGTEHTDESRQESPTHICFSSQMHKYKKCGADDIHRRRRVRSSRSEGRESVSSLPQLRHGKNNFKGCTLGDGGLDDELVNAIDTYRSVIDSLRCVGRNSDRHEKKYSEFLRMSKVIDSNSSSMAERRKNLRKEWQLSLEIYEMALLAQKEALKTLPFPPGTPRKRSASDYSQQAPTRIASTLIAMGGIYYKLNCVQDELRMYNEALAIYMEFLGHDHPHVAGTMKNIGMVLAEQGEFDEAMEKFQDALNIYESFKDGMNNSTNGSCCDVASALSCMGNIQNRRGELKDALRLYGEALVIYKAVSRQARELGGRSRLAIQEVAFTLKIMGMVHTKRDELDKAMTCFQDAIDIMRQNFTEKESGPIVTSTLSCIGCVFCKMEKLDEAMSHYQEAYDLATRTFGTTDHPEVAQVLHYIGGIHQKQGSLHDAMSCYENAAKIYQNTLGCDHPKVATTLVCIGSLHYIEKNLDSAMNYYTEALRLNRSAYGTMHPDVIPTMKSIALIHAKRENFDEAIAIFTEVLKIKSSNLGNLHPEVASAHKRIGNVHFQRGDLINAEKEYVQALLINQQTLGDDHLSTKSAQAIVEKIRKEVTKMQESHQPSSSLSNSGSGFFKRAPKGLES